MKTPIFQATTAQGKLVLRDPQAFQIWIKALGDGPVTVAVAKRKVKRSLDQNAWYWACIVGIPAQHFGYTPEEMHDAYKFMFLRREAPGKPTTMGSSAALSTAEFSQYCDRCRQFCAENGMVIPDPDTYAAHPELFEEPIGR